MAISSSIYFQIVYLAGIGGRTLSLIIRAMLRHLGTGAVWGKITPCGRDEAKPNGKAGLVTQFPQVLRVLTSKYALDLTNFISAL
jgi:hypothetical protein